MDNQNNFFENKIAVVTGGGGLLCSTIAIALASRKAKVILLGRHLEKLLPVKDQIEKNKGTAFAFECDTCDEESVQRIADKIQKEIGLCDFLVNGAGGNNSNAVTSIVEFDEKELNPENNIKGFYSLDMNEFSKVIINNTMGTVIPTKIFSKHMVGKGGSIVNFGSMNSYCPLTKVPAYAIAKAGIVNWTQWAATYFAPAGIRINAVAPGFFVNDRSIKLLGTVETGLTARGKAVIDHTPLKRFGKSEDMVGSVLWLLNSEESSFVTGITIPVDGGFLAKSGV